jgi:tRNA threonylcarbamoyladenosine biosynthesis protein TsaB
MPILALDTSLAPAGAALADQGRILGQATLVNQPNASRCLLEELEYLLRACGVAKTQLTGLAVTLGPGFFTGLRIGLASAQGLALGLGLAVAGVSTLRLLAAAFPNHPETVWALADARRGLIYAAPFRPTSEGLKRLGPDMAATPERLAPMLETPALLVGAGARVHAALLLRPGLTLAPAWSDHPNPGLLALLGEERLAAGQGLEPERLAPRYCRPSDAEVRFGLPLDEYRLLI